MSGRVFFTRTLGAIDDRLNGTAPIRLVRDIPDGAPWYKGQACGAYVVAPVGWIDFPDTPHPLCVAYVETCLEPGEIMVYADPEPSMGAIAWSRLLEIARDALRRVGDSYSREDAWSIAGTLYISAVEREARLVAQRGEV